MFGVRSAVETRVQLASAHHGQGMQNRGQRIPASHLILLHHRQWTASNEQQRELQALRDGNVQQDSPSEESCTQLRGSTVFTTVRQMKRLLF